MLDLILKCVATAATVINAGVAIWNITQQPKQGGKHKKKKRYRNGKHINK